MESTQTNVGEYVTTMKIKHGTGFANLFMDKLIRRTREQRESILYAFYDLDILQDTYRETKKEYYYE